MFKDNSDPVLFESPALENANMTVLRCREVMERTGMTAEAKSLEGFDVTSRRKAAIALEVLNSMKFRAEATYSRDIAVIHLQAAVGPVFRS